MFFFGLLFVFCMLLHFSVRVSRLERRLTALVQEIGLITAARRRRPRSARRARVGRAPPAEPTAARAGRGRHPVHSTTARSRTRPCGSMQEHERSRSWSSTTARPTRRRSRPSSELERVSVGLIRQREPGPRGGADDGRGGDVGAVRVPARRRRPARAGRAGARSPTCSSAPREAAFAWGDYLLFGDGTGRYRAPRDWLPWTLTFVNPYPVSSLVRRSAARAHRRLADARLRGLGPVAALRRARPGGRRRPADRLPAPAARRRRGC